MTTLTDSLTVLAEQLGHYQDRGAVLEPEAVRAVVSLLKVASEQARILERHKQKVTREHLRAGPNVVLWPIVHRSTATRAVFPAGHPSGDQPA